MPMSDLENLNRVERWLADRLAAWLRRHPWALLPFGLLLLVWIVATEVLGWWSLLRGLLP